MSANDVLKKIQELDQAEQEKERQQAEQRKADFEAALIPARQAMRDWLGEDIYDLFVKHAQEKLTTRNGIYPVIEWKLPALPDPHLAPMYIHYSDYQASDRYIKTCGASMTDVQGALLYAFRGYDEYLQEYQADRWNRLSRELRNAKTRTEMEQVYSTILGEFPDHADAIEQDRQAWIEREHARLMAEQERRERTEQHKRDIAIFSGLFREYMTEYSKVRAWRDEMLPGIQASINDPYTVYLLKYAVFAADEDGEGQIKTKSVFVIGEPFEGGWYLTTGGGRVKFYNPVSLEQKTVKPTDNIPGTHEIDLGEDDHLYFGPGTSEETIQAIVSTIPSLPDKPKYWEYGLSDIDYENIIESVAREE